jgi:hypothetical protein
MSRFVIPFSGFGDCPAFDNGDASCLKTILYEVERHCNNYFNPGNNPHDPQRNYPPAFIELVKRIYEYLKNENDDGLAKNITSYNLSEDDAGESWSREVVDGSWIKLFARELAIYKRIKFI